MTNEIIDTDILEIAKKVTTQKINKYTKKLNEYKKLLKEQQEKLTKIEAQNNQGGN